MTITLSFPTNVACADQYCKVNEYGPHDHTLYNVYEIPAHLHYDGITEITASEIATSMRPLEIAPVNSKKGVFQNV